MKWLVVVEDDLDKGGAMKTHVAEFCHALSKQDQVVFLSHTSLSSLCEDNTYDKRQVKAIRIWPHNLGSFLSTIKVFFYLQTNREDLASDVLYARAAAFGLGSLLFGKIHHIPLIVEINGAWDEEQVVSRKNMPPLRRILVTPLMKLRGMTIDLGCKMADRLITVTPNLANYLQNKGISPEKITIAQNGANIESFRPLNKQFTREQLRLDSSAKIIGFVGGLSAWQGVDDLILAFAQLPSTDTVSPQLMIVGDGTERQRLEALVVQAGVQGRVIFTGAIPYSLIPTYMSACDVLVAPKKPLKSGYSPLKIYEYMASARPIIASQVVGLEFIQEAGAGLLFEPGEIHELARRILEIMQMTEREREIMGERGREKVVNSYSWDATVQIIRNAVIRLGSNLS